MSQLPRDWHQIGCNAHTPVQCMLSDDRQFLGYQCHPQFDAADMRTVLGIVHKETGEVDQLTRGAVTLAQAEESLSRPVQAQFVAHTILGHFLSS